MCARFLHTQSTVATCNVLSLSLSLLSYTNQESAVPLLSISRENIGLSAGDPNLRFRPFEGLIVKPLPPLQFIIIIIMLLMTVFLLLPCFFFLSQRGKAITRLIAPRGWGARSGSTGSERWFDWSAWRGDATTEGVIRSSRK